MILLKKKYYDFVQNLPLFIPDPKIGDQLSSYLDKFPVTPYLDSRMSFMKWVHFLHNKINMKLGKEIISFDDSITMYYEDYKQNKRFRIKYFKNKFFFGIAALLGIMLFGYLYNK